MQPFRHILFPVDLSETSSLMAPHAMALANKFSASLHLVFVARMFDYFSELYVSDTVITNFKKAVMDGAEKRLLEFAGEYFSALPAVKTTILTGDIAEEILHYMQTEPIDLLVLGTHGRKGLEKVFFGSIAERLLKAATVPVFLVNPYRGERLSPPATPEELFRRILFPVDLTAISTSIVPFVRSMTAAFKAELELLCVLRTVTYFHALYVPDHSIFSFEEEMRVGAKRKLEEFKQTYFSTFPPTRTSVLVGDISEKILDHIRLKKIDLVIMGTHGRKGLDKIMFGSIAERVAKASPVPVLLVNPNKMDGLKVEEV